MIVAEFDPLLDEGIAYARALEAADVDVTLVETAGQPHDYWLNLGVVDEAERAVAEAARSMTRALQRR